MPGSLRPLDPWDLLLTGPESGVLHVGLAVPLSGPLALTAPSALDLAGLAVDEVNATGGVDGRELRLVAVDSGRAPAVVAAEAAALFEAGAFDVLVGFHTSDVHRALERVLPPGARYVFTPPHEGGRHRTGVVRTGVSPANQHAAALAWLVRHRRARRWVLLGTDYVWPRAVHRAAHRALAGTGAEVVGEALVPFGPTDMGPLLDLVRRTRADGVLLSMVGRDLVTFNREFVRAGLDRRVVRLSGALEENGLYAVGGDGTGELYACMPSFASGGSGPDEAQLALEERHASRSGPDAPVVCAYARGLYDGVRLAVSPGGTRRAARRTPAARLARAEGLALREIPGLLTA
ncbi:ABC transporter substrate-binding protein [Blastococcus saxobsidens]|uniref:Amino acid/amide ABC transporter substrate-binding protein (HAAT family) n=1 Tax=Blastococcus saxobsidens TaxID=138336 RepID=A0A4Q7Y4W1_9ACTN|nr:ABC transporter substrate-binding protein [Blastococcus saxobsidens]RZU31123.1 amino acid/amide ABC transporter substrate-binding protein (HAAT family) [Blastococcus saxobsidens]